MTKEIRDKVFAMFGRRRFLKIIYGNLRMENVKWGEGFVQAYWLSLLCMRGGSGMRRPLKIQIGEDVNWVHTEALVKPISVFARKRSVSGYGIVVQVKSCPPRKSEVRGSWYLRNEIRGIINENQ